MNDNASNALEIENLCVEFRTDDRTVYAVNGLNLTIRRGQTLGLVGETGAGKTTTGLAVLDLIQSPPGVITSGRIAVNGETIICVEEDKTSKNIGADGIEGKINENPENHKYRAGEKKLVARKNKTTHMSSKELQKMQGKTVSMIFQDPMTSLNPVLTVEDQIAEVIEYHEHLSHKESVTKARSILEMVGIPSERGSEYPHQFSGGMKQRVVIAMALACDPDLLIADEPTTALDVTIQAQVLDMMKKLRERNNTSMLMITHDLGIVAEVCDCVSIVYAGTVVEHGTLEDVFDHTLHPYTQGLFNSLPNMDDRSVRLKPIRGLMPDPSNLPKGCAFCDRCDYATRRCFQEKPKLIHRNEEHYVLCHLYNAENIYKGGVLRNV